MATFPVSSAFLPIPVGRTIRKLKLMEGAELQWLRQVKRRRALQGCNYAEG